MKTTVNELASKLKKIKGFVPPKSDTVPGILYDSGTLIASNIEITVVTKLASPNLSGERFIIPPKAVEVIASLPDGDIEVTSDNNVIKIKSKTINCKFATADANISYPGELEIQNNNLVPVIPERSITLTKNLKSIMHCCSSDPTKSIYTGVRFDIDESEGTMNLVACDGFRIAITSESATVIAHSMSVSANAIHKILSLENSEGIQVYQNEKKACFITGNYTVYASMLNGDFINYKAAFPVNPKARLIFEQKNLVNCLERSIICASDKKPAVTVTSENGIGGATLVHFRASTPYSESDETVTAISSVEGEINADYNAKYLLDCFKAYGDGQITFEYYGNASPVIIDNGELKQMILPVRQKKKG